MLAHILISPRALDFSVLTEEIMNSGKETGFRRIYF